MLIGVTVAPIHDEVFGLPQRLDVLIGNEAATAAVAVPRTSAAASAIMVWVDIVVATISR